MHSSAVKHHFVIILKHSVAIFNCLYYLILGDTMVSIASCVFCAEFLDPFLKYGISEKTSYVCYSRIFPNSDLKHQNGAVFFYLPTSQCDGRHASENTASFSVASFCVIIFK
ncbi:hypothetical protein GOODEAATRI_018971 [Goodea atripinnis]|uniref:Secreted protein n=1 Tax=Goodea atripinnis TaxID=208336 RepID=A0ABV0MJ04_9TELE